MKTKEVVRNALCICAIMSCLVPKITLAIPNPAVTIVAPKSDGTVMPYEVQGQNTYWVLGYQFMVNQNLTVSQLGIYDWLSDGLASPHQVGLWKDDGTLLGSVSFSAGSGTFDDYFRYLPVDPVTLFSGQKYRIGVTYVDNDFADRIDYDVSPFTSHNYNPAISWLITADQENQTGTVLEFPTILEYWYISGQPQTPASLLGPNFQFEPVPEPTTMLLLGSGLIGLLGYGRKKFFKK